MGRSDILNSEIEDEALEAWLQDKLEHATSLLSGNGRVTVERVDPLRVDVDLKFQCARCVSIRSDGAFPRRLPRARAVDAGHRDQRNEELQTLLPAD